MGVNFRNTLFLFLLLACFTNTYAQDSSKSGSIYSADLSFGFGAVTDFAFTGTGEFHLQKEHHLVTFQILYTKEIVLSFPFTRPIPREQVLNFGLLYGRTYSFHLQRMLFPFFPISLLIKRETDYSFSVSAGVSGFKNVLRGTILYKGINTESQDVYNEDQQFSFGVPVQVEFVQYFSSSVGYTHRFYYNINNRKNFWGLLLGVQYKFSE